MADPAADAAALFEAGKGIGTNEEKFIEILCNRPRSHLRAVRDEYQKQFGKDMLKLIRREFSGHQQAFMLACVYQEGERRARFLRDAVKGPGTTERSVVDVIMTAKPSEIAACRDFFNATYTIKFDTRVKLETCGAFQKVLEAAMSPTRPESGVEEEKMGDDLELFFQATEGKVGTLEADLAKLVATRSQEHLLALNHRYTERSPKGKTAFEVVFSETSGYLREALCAVFMPPVNWYAYRIHTSCHGPGTDEVELLTNLALPTSAELKIAADYMQKIFKSNLEEVVARDTSGKLELALVTYIKYHLGQTYSDEERASALGLMGTAFSASPEPAETIKKVEEKVSNPESEWVATATQYKEEAAKEALEHKAARKQYNKEHGKEKKKKKKAKKSKKKGKKEEKDSGSGSEESEEETHESQSVTSYESDSSSSSDSDSD